jgi:hypothetical protein
MKLDLTPFLEINRVTRQRNMVIGLLVVGCLIGATTIYLYQKKLEEIQNRKKYY